MMKKIAPISTVFVFLIVSLACSMPFANTNGNDGSDPRATASGSQPGTSVTPQAQQQTIVPQTYEDQAIKIIELNQLPDLAADRDPDGAVCFVSGSQGMACYDAGEWEYFDAQSGKLDTNYLYKVEQCSDGSILIAQTGKVTAFSPEGNKTTVKFPDGFYASVVDLACVSTDDFWMTHSDGITHVLNQTFETYAITDIIPEGVEYALVEKSIFDQSGSLWVTLPNHILRYQDQSWTVYSEENGFSEAYFIEDIIKGGDDAVYAAASRVLLRNEGNYWEAIEYPDYATAKGLAVDPSGNVWVYGDGFLWNYEISEKTWSVFDISNHDYATISPRINAVKIDQSGKFWISSDWGVGVWDGQSWTSILMSNSPLIDDQIEDVVLLGESAAIPDVVEETPGKLTGSIFDEKEKPISGITIQICVNYLSDYTLTNLDPGETPCESQPYYQEVQTDSNGYFAFESVPEGFYYLTAEIEPEMWALLTGDFGFGEEVPIVSEEVLDIGELYVTVDE